MLGTHAVLVTNACSASASIRHDRLWDGSGQGRRELCVCVCDSYFIFFFLVKLNKPKKERKKKEKKSLVLFSFCRRLDLINRQVFFYYYHYCSILSFRSLLQEVEEQVDSCVPR